MENKTNKARKQFYIEVVLCFITVFVILLLVFIPTLSAQQIRTSAHISFRWDKVTLNADGTECTDLAGYAIYRSRESGNWDGFIGKDNAYRIITKNQTEFICICNDNLFGVWFWMMRAFDETNQFGEQSKELEIFIDSMIPGDINNDGHVDGTDLSIFSVNFGK